MEFKTYLKEKMSFDFPPLYHGTSSEQLVRTKHFNTKDKKFNDFLQGGNH
jgi:hypothetical protein